MNCDRCGVPAVAGAEFCGACGARLHFERGAVALPRREDWPFARAGADTDASDAERRETWLRRGVFAVAAVIVLELIVGVAQIAPERHQHRTAAQLNAAHVKVRAAESALQRARDDLAVRTKERDRFYTESQKTRGELGDARNSLAFTGGQLATFKECHRLVNEFIDAVDAEDLPKARALEPQAEKACDAADRLL